MRFVLVNCLICLLAASPVFAQKSGSDKLHVVINDSEEKRSLQEMDFQINLKVNPLMAICGEVPVYAEVPLGKRFGFEAGVGYIFKGLAPTFDGFLEHEILDDEHDLDKWPNVHSGFLYKGSIRYYKHFNDDLEGAFYALSYRHRAYNFSRTLDPEAFKNTAPVEWSAGENDFLFECGAQWEIKKNISLEYYTGAGVGMIDRYQMTNSAAVDAKGIYHYGIEPSTHSSLLFLYNIGLKVEYELSL
jgi:hypothetical protein